MGKVQSLEQSSSSTAQHTVKAASHQEDFSFLWLNTNSTVPDCGIPFC